MSSENPIDPTLPDIGPSEVRNGFAELAPLVEYVQRTGDREKLGELAVAYYAPLLRLAQVVLNEFSLLELNTPADMVQTVIMKVYAAFENREQAPDGTIYPLPAWGYFAAAVYNRARDLVMSSDHRRMQLVASLEEYQLGSGATQDDYAAFGVSSAEEGHFAHWERAAAKADVARIMEHLSPEYREFLRVLLLHTTDGRMYAEPIAAELGITTSVYHARLSRLKGRIHRLVKSGKIILEYGDLAEGDPDPKN